MSKDWIDTVALYPHRMTDGKDVYVLIFYPFSEVHELCPESYFLLLKEKGYLDQVKENCESNGIEYSEEDGHIIDCLIQNAKNLRHLQIVPKAKVSMHIADSLNDTVMNIENMLAQVEKIWPKESLCTTEE